MFFCAPKDMARICEVLILEIYNLSEGSWSSNCYALISRGADGINHAAIVDPSAKAQNIVALLDSKQAKLDFIILTHGHFDHILQLDELRALTGAPAYIQKDDAEMLSDGRKNAFSLFFGSELSLADADRLLDGGEMLTLGEEQIQVISTPGHSRGSICLLCPDFIVTGDTIFAEGYGRYDLYGGDLATLRESLISLKKYPRHLRLYAGHGAESTLGSAIENLYL
jgi:glyoxylase-like metal-dependent hydrolase (beta-lactamase superfamily II)